MTDSFGKLPLPPTSPGTAPLTGDVVAAGDPFLTYALSYFRAFLNARATTLWQSAGVAPTLAVINNTFAHDPASHNFTGKHLPALYMWRTEGGASEQFAEDWLVQRDKITMLWVFPGGQDGTSAGRLPVAAALHKLIVTALERNHDPAWIVPGDTDPRAATIGSDFAAFAGFMVCNVAKWKLSKLIVRGNNVTDVFDTLEVTTDVTEKVNYDLDDPTHGGATPRTDLTVQTTDSPPLVMDQARLT